MDIAEYKEIESFIKELVKSIFSVDVIELKLKNKLNKKEIREFSNEISEILHLTFLCFQPLIAEQLRKSSSKSEFNKFIKKLYDYLLWKVFYSLNLRVGFE